MVVWNGYKLTIEEAQQVSGITNVFWYDEFNVKIHAAINYAENIYLSLNENDRAVIATPYQNLRLPKN